MGASVRIQTVLFETPADVCARLVGSLEACADLAVRKGSAQQVTVAFGDCSPKPCADEDQRTELIAAAGSRRSISLEWRVWKQNLGHGAGQNQLARDAAADVLVMVNPDAYPAPAALHELLVRLAEPGVGLVEGRQLPFETPRYVDPGTGDTPWCAGALLGVGLPLFHRLGGFDEAFFLHGDDVDLSWRVRDQGLRLVYAARAAVYHTREIDPTGYASSSDAEAYHIHLAELLRAWKARRADLVAELIERTEREGHPWQHRANQEFRRRRNQGALPAPYDFDATPFLAEYGQRRF